ncbi:MAG: leucine-rich repeat domain-containing protein, partial [Bacteroidota bacterium]|nr:leucine-rich repeat domain-containing protein [Bacteroidota bacterium]
AQTENVDMSKYITLTVTQGDSIQLNIAASSTNTGIKLVSGTWDTTLVVGTSYTGYKKYPTASTTMTIYGNVQWFGCGFNGSKITAMDCSHSTALSILSCSNNRLTTLNLDGLTNFTKLYCTNTKLTSLNLSGHTNLEYVACNGGEITSLDVSGNTSLKELYCYNNQLSIQAIDNIYCQLTDRTSRSAGTLVIANSDSDATVLASNKTNATDKNWAVQYNASSGYLDFPATTGTYVCPEPEIDVDMTKYITLTVTQGETIKLNMTSSSENTGIKVVSGTWDTTLIAGTDYTGDIYYNAASTTMTIYGGVEKFICKSNSSKITGLDASNNTTLKSLDCRLNRITSLDVTGLTSLEELRCGGNRITSLDVSGLTSLQELHCSTNLLTSLTLTGLINLKSLICNANQLTSLDATGLTSLEELSCYGNQLTGLNVVGLANLEILDCNDNQLTSLNLTGLTNLKELYCYTNQIASLDFTGLTNLEGIACYSNQLTSLDISGLSNLWAIASFDNPLSTQVIDRLYCQLPDRTSQSTPGILLVASSDIDETVLATNKTNATDKNWTVGYYEEGEEGFFEFPATTGTYVCGSEEEPEPEPEPEPSALSDVETEGIILYPNPAKEEITLKGIRGEEVRVFDLSGKLVKQETINEKLDIRDLESGVYYIQVKGMTSKLIKN